MLLCYITGNLYSQQILIDDLDFSESSTRSSRTYWDKDTLLYCIDHYSTQLSNSDCQTVIRNAFNTWSKYSNFVFVQTTSINESDIIISWETGTHGICTPFSSSVLAHAYVGKMEAGASFVHFNDQQPFSVDSTLYDIETTALHELGHVLGLEHIANKPNTVMYPYQSYGFYGIKREPTLEDVEALYAIYGHPRYSLIGKHLIPQQEIFKIGKLHPSYSVEWSLSDSYYNQNCLQQNYPGQNQCTITRNSNQRMVNATLTAIIKHNGIAIDTLTKTGLYAYNDFYGEYTCDTISGIIDYTHVFYVRPGYSTFISSPNLVNATVSYDPAGTTPLYLFLEPTQWRLSFTTPINNNGVPVILDIDDVLGNHYKLYAMPRGSFYFNIAYGDGYINVTLESDDEKALKTKAIEQPWSYEIRSASMGALKASKSINTRSTTISTAGWPKGVYIIKAKIGKEEVTEKIVVK